MKVAASVLVLASFCGACTSSDPVPGVDTLRSDYPLVGDELHPEGIAFDPKQRRFLFGSLTEGTLFSLDADGNQQQFAEAPGEGAATLGLAVDEERRVLWACAQPTRDGSAEAVRRYDLDTGALLGTTMLEDASAGAQCNDLMTDDAGAVYVTDPAAPRLYRVEADGAASVFLEDDALTPTIAGLGANGITLSPDGATLFVAYFSPPAVFSVPVASPEDLVAIALTGDPFEGMQPISGPDGLVMHDGDLVVVFDDAVHRIKLDDARTGGAVTSVALNGLSGLSTAAVAEGGLYVAKSEVVAQVLGRDPELPFRIVRIP